MTNEDIQKLLTQVKYPGMGRDIVSFGMVKSAAECDGAGKVLIEVSTQDAAVVKTIETESRGVLEKARPDIRWTVEVRQKIDIKGAPAHAHGPQKTALPGVKRVVAIASGKGGVGKSTVATNVALALAKGGASVGLMDADVYGPSLPVMYGLQGHPQMTESQQLIPLDFHGIKVMSLGFLTTPDTPVIWRGPIVSKLIQQFLGGVAWGALDYLVVDLPPGTGDVQLTLVQSAPLAGAVIVTTPQEVALTIANKGLKMFHEVNVPVIGIVENMSGFVCPHCGEETDVFKRGGGERLAKLSGVPLLGRVPLEAGVAEAGDAGVPVIERAPDSRSARAYREIADAIVKQLDAGLASGGAWVATPTKMEAADDGRLLMEWTDGHASVHGARALRAACPCAACVDEMTGERVIRLEQVPAAIRPLEISTVGRYAVQIRWSDGHASGIYPFRYLRTLCECASCKKVAATATR